MASFQPTVRTIDQRRTQVQQVDAGAGGITRYSMFATVSNPGETIVPVTFPVIFAEKPVYYWGAEMDPGSVVADGGYPMVCPVVRNWVTRVDKNTGARSYMGATILVITTGVDTQVMTIGCHFEGRGLWGPG